MNNKNINDSQIGQTADGFGLNFLVRNASSPKKKALILLHGVGSNENDLFSLADKLPEDFYIISPRGQFTLGAGRYAWYQVDFSTGKPVFDAEQEMSSRKIILQFVTEIKEAYQLEQVYLGGFSQGAIMSYTIGLTHPTDITGVISLSGRVLEEIQPLTTTTSDALKGLKVYIAHGIQDGTLPVQYARTAKALMEKLGVQLKYREHNMGHQITQAVIDDINEWLAADTSENSEPGSNV